MAVVKRMSSKAKVKKLETYLKQDFKTEENLISGINCDSDNFAKQCEMTSLLYRKNQEKDDRKYYHIIQSFSPLDNQKLTYEQAHELGKQFAEKNFQGHEVLVVTHKDKDHIHNHFVVNSVNFENGKKYRADNKSLWKLRRTSNELCKENGLVNSIQELGKRAKEKMKSGELRKTLRSENVWKLELKAQITECASTSSNETEFKAKMIEKYNVEVKERTKTRKGQKIIIYEYKPKGNRKFFDGEKRLGIDYGKEHIRNGFIGRSEEKARRNDTRVNAEQQLRTVDTRASIKDRGTNTDRTDLAIAELKARGTDRTIARANERRAETQNPFREDKQRVKPSRGRER